MASFKEIKRMKLKSILLFCLINVAFCGCDSIYQKKSKPLFLKADSTISNCLRVEGVSAVFPDVKKIFITNKNSTIAKSEILIVIFFDKKDLEVFKNKIEQESNKSIENIKLKIGNQKKNYIVLQTNTNPTNTVLPNALTVFKDGLWIVFYSEFSQNIETYLEFKRIGISEIPETRIMTI